MIESYLWLIPLGFLGGLVGSMIGLGGGIITMPALIFAGFNPIVAANSSLFGTCSNAIASTISYSRHFKIDYKIGLRFASIAIAGTVLGAYASMQVNNNEFKILLIIILAVAGIYILFGKKIVTNRSSELKIAILSILASLLAGIISSFFGVGGGIVFMPLLIAVFGLNINKAASISQFALILISVSSITVHAILGNLELIFGLLLASGSFCGGIVGARLAIEIQNNILRILGFGVVFFSIGYTLLDYIYSDM